MEAKPVVATVDLFFSEAKILHKINQYEVVFFESMHVPLPQKYLCITSNGEIFYCLVNKTGLSKIYETKTSVTEGMVTLLNFLYSENKLLKQNGDHTVNINDSIEFVDKLINILKFRQGGGVYIKNNKRKSKKRKSNRKRRKSNRKRRKSNRKRRKSK